MGIVDDRTLNKQLLKDNLKNPENLDRIKADNLAASRKIAGYGRRQLWQQDKMKYQWDPDKPAKKRYKDKMVVFTKDGGARYPEEIKWSLKFDIINCNTDKLNVKLKVS